MSLFQLPFPDIDPVAIRLGPITIQWYALMYLLAFAVGYLLLRRRLNHEPYRSITKPEPYTKTVVEDVLTAVILGVLIGGRLGYCLFYKPIYYLTHPLDIFKVWEGGMSFHGGAIGVLLAFIFYAWRHHRPMLQVADLVVPAAPLGLFFGRIGNFINGELWGRQAPADLPWAMVFPTGGDVPRHPSQIYQALLEGLTLFVILWLFARKKRYRGQVAGLFVAGYGVFRFIGELFREPDAHLGYLMGLSMGQWLSLPMVLAGVALLVWASRRRIDDTGSEIDTDSEPDDSPDPEAEQSPQADEEPTVKTEPGDEEEPTAEEVESAEETADDTHRSLDRKQADQPETSR